MAPPPLENMPSGHKGLKVDRRHLCGAKLHTGKRLLTLPSFQEVGG